MRSRTQWIRRRMGLDIQEAFGSAHSSACVCARAARAQQNPRQSFASAIPSLNSFATARPYAGGMAKTETAGAEPRQKKQTAARAASSKVRWHWRALECLPASRRAQGPCTCELRTFGKGSSHLHEHKKQVRDTFRIINSLLLRLRCIEQPPVPVGIDCH